MQQIISIRTSAINIAQVILGILAIWASAEISIPLKPVAITLHTVTVMAICLTYTPILARSTVLGYLLAGALGAPVFVNFQSGLPYMMGPTGGYIAGLWLCSILMPYFSKTYGLSTLSIFLNCLLGQALVYIPGVLWLSNFVGAESAIYNGFLVYIPSGLVKMLVLVTIMRYLGLGRK